VSEFNTELPKRLFALQAQRFDGFSKAHSSLLSFLPFVVECIPHGVVQFQPHFPRVGNRKLGRAFYFPDIGNFPVIFSNVRNL
jgi:hypothetical protein